MKKTSFRIFIVCLIASLLICVGLLIVSLKLDNIISIDISDNIIPTRIFVFIINLFFIQNLLCLQKCIYFYPKNLFHIEV